MKRSLVLLSALVLALALSLSDTFGTRTVSSADIHEKCLDCSVRNFEQYEHCVAIHGLDELRCSDQYNEGVVHCFRNFCEQ